MPASTVSLVLGSSTRYMTGQPPAGFYLSLLLLLLLAAPLSLAQSGRSQADDDDDEDEWLRAYFMDKRILTFMRLLLKITLQENSAMAQGLLNSCQQDYVIVLAEARQRTQADPELRTREAAAKRQHRQADQESRACEPSAAWQCRKADPEAVKVCKTTEALRRPQVGQEASRA
ncbi:hypothetical protein HPB51_022318 [Rhipicephalus microplus]|uniref:Secreted protein n=1 Tax=Rhipicephalus microplus TaxID=6941 RepID=A0A9J6DPT6_RHIMP|nr:hypothetical protein HPB51_022318 [Rhipicephalus microplus]